MTDNAREPFDPTDMSDPRYDPAGDPTHPFYEGDKSAPEAQSDPSDEDVYKVGPGLSAERAYLEEGWSVA